MEFHVHTPAELREPAEQLLKLVTECPLVLLEGDMGTGKTTFVKEVCRMLGSADNVSSPTYALVNEYLDAAGNPVYHFDLYRLKDPSEAGDLGIYDYIDSGCLCLVEWPGMAGELLYSEPHIKISFRLEDAERILTFTRH